MTTHNPNQLLAAAHAIEAIELSKDFPKTSKPSVSNLSFSIPAGETVAFLGPNGAGKSTTIKMLCGILAPSRGSAKILGMNAGTKEANGSLGLVFGTRSQLFFHMTVGDCFDLLAEIYFVTGETKRSRIREMADAFQITHFLSRRVRTLSLGERMRCEVVAALLHRPKVLLADEPTIGLDIIAKNSLRTLIKHWQLHEKTTLMLTSHDLSDVEALCDRCILIDQGQKKYDGPLDLLKGDLGYLRNILVTTTDTSKAPIVGSKFFLSVKALSPYTHLYEFSMDKFPMSQVIFALTEYYGEALNDLGIQKVSLEEVLEVRYASRD